MHAIRALASAVADVIHDLQHRIMILALNNVTLRNGLT